MIPKRLTLPERPQPVCELRPGEIQLAFYFAMQSYLENGCEGLINRDESLRLICLMDAEHWPKVKASVFDNQNCFRLVGGRWHHVTSEKGKP